MNKYFYFIFLLLASSCISTENPEPARKTYYLDQELYDYAIFPKGSWWVYEEESSGFIDSVIVISYDKVMIRNSNSVDYNYELLYIDYFSSQQGEIDGFATARYEGSNNYNRYSERNTIDASVPNKFKFLTGKSVEDTVSFIQSRKMVRKQPLDSLKIIDSTHYDILVFDQLNGSSQVINTFYFAKNTGLIKEEDKENNKTWLLSRHHINN